MTLQEATEAAQTLRELGWDVRAKADAIGSAQLFATPVAGAGRSLCAFSIREMNSFVARGYVAKLAPSGE
jgi:hypothetical protein